MTSAVGSALAGLNAALADLTPVALVGLSRDELLTLADQLETHRRQFASVDHVLVAQLEQRGVAREVGARDTADLLVQRLRISRRCARRRFTDAQELGPRVGVSGEPLPPIFPAVAQAQAAGVISDEHAHLVMNAIDALPAELAAPVVDSAERFLVEKASEFEPGQLRSIAQRLLDTLDPDGRLQTDADHQRRRHLRLHRNPDGSAELSGHLSPEAGSKLQVVLDALSAPQPATDGTADPRTAGQRCHDALLDLTGRILNSATLPDCGGAPVTLLLTTTPDQLVTRAGTARTGHGTHIDTPLALRLADSAELNLLVFDDISHQLRLGRTSRLARPALRKALAVRDRGCSFPGCTTPSSWCQAHHVIAWLDGGLTDLDNLTLLCGHHHRNFEPTGWSCQMIDNRPYWTPPTWLDPDQTSRLNTAHHLDHITFALPADAA